MAAIRTLGPGKLTITDTGKGRDFSAQVTKVQLAASNNTDDPINFLDGSQDTSTSTDWTLEGTIVDDFDADNLSAWCFDHAGEQMPFVKSKNTNDFSFPVTDLRHDAYSGTITAQEGN